jgi:restriction endonuclease
MSSDPLDHLLADVDPSALCSFEQPVPNVPIKSLQWSVEKYEVAQLLALSRMTLLQVSEETGVPAHAIRRWKAHPDFQEYMDNITLETANTLKAKRLQVLRKILDARLELVEESGNYAALSSKDTLDILDAIRKETEAQESQPESNYLKTIEDLFKRTMAKKGLGGASQLLTE